MLLHPIIEYKAVGLTSQPLTAFDSSPLILLTITSLCAQGHPRHTPNTASPFTYSVVCLLYGLVSVRSGFALFLAVPLVPERLPGTYEMFNLELNK